MPITIGSNLGSLRAQRRLADNSSALSQVFERLSTGQRINRASDDAAGLAISETLSSKSRVFNRAAKNLNDGISLLNMADGALEQTSRLLERMGELSAQAANGTLSNAQRETLNKEFNALDHEIRRIAASTEFNSQDILSGSKNNQSYEMFTPGFTNDIELSGDGKFYAGADPSGTSNLRIRDNESGETRIVSVGSSVDVQKTLNNGDVFFRASNVYYKYDYSAGSYEEILDLTSYGAVVGAYEISEDGNTIVFSSEVQFEDGSTIDQGTLDAGNRRLTFLDIDSGTITQLDNVVSLFTAVKISADGNTIAFNDNVNDIGGLAGSQSDILTVTRDGTSLSEISNLVDGLSGTSLDAVTNDGIVTFRSIYDIGGLNPGGTINFFRVAPDSSLSKLTNWDSAYTLTDVTLSTDSSIITFTSSNDILGENADGISQLYRIDLTTGSFEQVSQLTSSDVFFSGIGGYSADGSHYTILGSDGIADTRLYDATSSTKNFDFEAGFGSAGNIQISVASLLNSVRGLGTFTLSSQDSALSALERVKADIANIGAKRSIIGAGLS
ncbi:MAG: hypothetical protein KDD42_08025, partial [Bdellovibrionales bacterium]|nr:hypothetical protein [Bdellovibrionales bacterium]